LDEEFIFWNLAHGTLKYYEGGWNWKEVMEARGRFSAYFRN